MSRRFLPLKSQNDSRSFDRFVSKNKTYVRITCLARLSSQVQIRFFFIIIVFASKEHVLCLKRKKTSPPVVR